MGGGSSKNKNRVMPSSQEVSDWRAKLEKQKNDARGKAESLKSELDGLSGVQEALANAEAEAKALQAQLKEAKKLAAKASERKREVEKAKADANSLAAQAEQTEKDRVKIIDEIESMPSREELVKKVMTCPLPSPWSPTDILDWHRGSEGPGLSLALFHNLFTICAPEIFENRLQVQQANEAAESAQAQLDDARRLAAEASDKKSTMVQRKAEAEEALAEADRDKAEAESLLTEAEQAETDRLKVVKEIEVMPSREEIMKTVRRALDPAVVVHPPMSQFLFGIPIRSS